MLFFKPLKKRTILLIMMFFGCAQFNLLKNSVAMATHVYGLSNVKSKSMVEESQVNIYYVYSVLEIACGRLSERSGGKIVAGFGILGASMLSIFIPYAVHTGGYDGLGIISGIMGVCLVGIYPAFFSMASKWITAEERGKLVCSFSTHFLGIVLMTLILQLEPFLSKETIFIIPGVFGMIWTLCWYMLVYDSPMTHPSITRQEKKHIVLTKESEGTIYNRAIDFPWFELCFDPHVWTIFTTNTCFMYGAIFLYTRSSLYLLETFKLSPQKDPLLFLLPYLLSFSSSFFSGFLFDFLYRLRIPLILLQKIYAIICTISTAIVFVGMILFQNNIFWTLFFYMFGFALHSWFYGAFFTSFLDSAPNFAATLNAISFTVTSVFKILIDEAIDSLDAGLERQEQWQNRHSLVSALFFTAGIMFTLFGSSNRADWNTPIHNENEDG